MTAIAVHEINNVLQWLRMTLDIAGQETKKYDPQLQTKLAPAVADARLGVEHIADIVRELRELRRPYAHKPDAFDPTEALRVALAIGGPRIGKRAQLVEEISPLPLVRGRKHDLVCVFLNLLLNAAQAIPEGEEGHSVTVRAAVEPDGAVLVEIEDTGVGVPEDLAASIFEPYITSRRGKGGSGLGLHVSRRIVREMGGQIGFEPRTNRGTRFWIVLRPSIS